MFTDDSDGKRYFHINIPETIDGLPVLVVDQLCLDVDYKYHYRHNGLDVVKIHIPENTAFLGLQKISTGMGSVFIPYFSEEYYKRQNELLRKDEGVYHFLQKNNDNSCDIYAIICDNQIKKEWIWLTETHKLDDAGTLVIPSMIEGCKVCNILADSTRALLENIKTITFEEGIEVIEESCFSILPYLTDVFLAKSIKNICNKAFEYYEKDEYIKKFLHLLFIIMINYHI